MTDRAQVVRRERSVSFNAAASPQTIPFPARLSKHRLGLSHSAKPLRMLARLWAIPNYQSTQGECQMRTINDHKVNPANDRIGITVMDEPGAGGANHVYRVAFFDNETTGFSVEIKFQNGPINEAGVNGLTQEVLLAIVADRLRSFQAGQFACRENAIALTKIEEAQHWLHARTRGRMIRGVEGTHAA